jgi:DNA-binding transcriptional LysR family regulator
VAGRVAVAFVWSTLSEFLPRLVAAAAERHRQIELSVSQLAYMEILPALRRGDVDLVITRRLWEQHEMVELTLMHEPSVVAVPERHDLAREASIPIARLQGEPMIALNRALAPRAYDAVLDAARARGIEFRIVQHVRSATEALALVSAGIGVYRMPASATQPHPGVVFVEIADASSRVVLVRRPAPPPAPVAAIEELARSLFNDARDASNDVADGLEEGAVRS